jgi:hypothetical protein
MTDERISPSTHDLLLPETDFPQPTIHPGQAPGDIDYLEQRLRPEIAQIRSLWYRNHADLVHAANVEDRLPSGSDS